MWNTKNESSTWMNEVEKPKITQEQVLAHVNMPFNQAFELLSVRAFHSEGDAQIDHLEVRDHIFGASRIFPAINGIILPWTRHDLNDHPYDHSKGLRSLFTYRVDPIFDNERWSRIYWSAMETFYDLTLCNNFLSEYGCYPGQIIIDAEVEYTMEQEEYA